MSEVAAATRPGSSAILMPEVRPVAVDPAALPRMMSDLARRYLLWDAFVGGERRVDAHPLVLPAEMHESAVRAACSVARAVTRTADLAFEDDGERTLYRLHDDVHLLARASQRAGDRAALVRVDLLLGEDGRWRACEINADCPGGHNEALALPRLSRLCGFMDGRNPTVATSALAARLAELAEGEAVGLIYATAYAEDLQVCAIVQRALIERGVPAVLAPPTAPRLERGRLMIGPRRVGALYRYFPTEYMAGQTNVSALAAAVEGGAVRTLTSFAHIYAQSKLAFARAWRHWGALAEEDRAAVARYTPETHDVLDVPPAELLSARERWVLKRAYGRVGDEVFVGSLVAAEAWPKLVVGIRGMAQAGESWIAQRFVPQAPIDTPWGKRFLTLGAYVLDGAFVGYFARVTPASHVSHGAMCVPVFHLGHGAGSAERGGRA